MSSWTSLVMCVTFLLNLYLDKSDAVQCYSCLYSDNLGPDSQHCLNPSSNDTTTCDDKTCSLTSVSGSTAVTMRNCTTGTTGTTCVKLNVFGSSSTTCTCDGSLCNGVDMNTLKNAATDKTSETHMCYSCTYESGVEDSDNCQFPSEETPMCTGNSCVSGSTKANGGTVIVRACATGTVQTDCYSATVAGATFKLCTCTSEMCNAASSHSLKIIPMAMIITALYFVI